MPRLIVASCIAVGMTAGASLPVSNDWQVIVRPLQSGTTNAGLYWVGLRNNTARPRAFCVLGVRFTLQLKDGSLVDHPSTEYPSVGSPHQCAPTIGHLVLPGETHFVKVRVVPLRNAETRGSVSFRVIAEETCVDAEPCPHRSIFASEDDSR